MFNDTFTVQNGDLRISGSSEISLFSLFNFFGLVKCLLVNKGYRIEYQNDLILRELLFLGLNIAI